MSGHYNETTNKAIQLLAQLEAGTLPDPDDLRKAIVDLKREQRFDLARRILEITRRHDTSFDSETRIWLGQQHALCTYKDPDLPTNAKLDQALDILERIDRLADTHNQETLGLAGAIYKRKWQFEGLIKYLHRSLAYYLRGYLEGVRNDQGYTGINAAYVLDLLAAQEQKESSAAGINSEAASVRRSRADEIRRTIIEELTEEARANPKCTNDWWFLVTLGEAYFGLGQWNEAARTFEVAAALPNPPQWQYESTARQLASLARLRTEYRIDDAKNALRALLRNPDAVDRTFSGKVGLALSGGGFRAALFHIGVLARLAELDVLRHVEVLSCVSGGSIVGAHYYLKLKLLLENGASPLPQEAYIRLVQELKNEFLEGVQRNIRVRVATNLFKSAKMILLPGYSRTHRAGELYESELYNRIKDMKKPVRSMSELLIHPFGQSGFNLKRDNWQCYEKIPMLVINTTPLNTGHAWQFTGTWMGEPPADVNTDVDANYRLRRMYYEDAPESYRNVAVGHAVGASACVPGIFAPLEMADLYEGKTVRLVDGGVHDNQGIGSLLEEECSVLLVSDASGQMSAEDDPGDGLISVPLRTNDILQARVREAEYADLAGRVRSGLLQGLMFIHLKKGLDVEPVSWIGCRDRKDESPITTDTTPYGVLKSIQARLAAIRTDLDSFSDVEAHALMTSGYLMTCYEFAASIENFPPPVKPLMAPVSWDFLNDAAGPISDKHDPRHKLFAKVLSVSHLPALKVWFLSRPLQILATSLGVLAAGMLIYAWASGPRPALVSINLTVPEIGGLALGFLLTKLFGKRIAKIFSYRKTLNETAMGFAFITFGWILAWLHLLFFDRLYLKIGRTR